MKQVVNFKEIKKASQEELHNLLKDEHAAGCVGCLHRCPKTAISCGPNTAKHGRYEWKEP